ncbi:glycosyltransferase family 4 protein [Stutzerimonas azotifigens]|uniref:Glycosyltransferase family 4 protein n=1 Tax=Stutzerimonas azotifigens TaxID=291995 RepID=A0ABR5Z529_9GAMM|nr:glycosyltransferase family 1 protein [Stutzerimonas azotifigens]MBA1275227.1 glycosyltransferase family 4 protein [Stutzerimonas azotifigens]
MNLILSVDPVRFPLTGIGRYTYELARVLESTDGVKRLRYFSGARFVSGLPSPSDTSDSGHGLRRMVQKSALAIEAYRVLMPLLRARALRDCSDALYHGTNFFIPPFPGKSVATFHDLSPFTWAHCHAPQRIRYLQKELGKTLERADALITDSEFTRRELAAYFSWPIEHIHAVPLASSEEFRPRTADELRDVLAGHGLEPGGYSLFVGTLEPRKNIETLLDAYGRLPAPLKKRWPLVLTGYQGWRNDEIRKRLDQAVDEGWARHLGFVPSEDLPLLFAGARLFTFPSLYEGFGLPVLEAMSSGVPVVCSNSSSLPEVAGNAALMCDPQDTVALTELIARGLEDESWRVSAITDGLTHAASFSWQRCAMQTMDVYRRVLSVG